MTIFRIHILNYLTTYYHIEFSPTSPCPIVARSPALYLQFKRGVSGMDLNNRIMKVWLNLAQSGEQNVK